jgi:hypothetical protein
VIVTGANVKHAEFGIREMIGVLGDTATDEFFGEQIDIAVHELIVRRTVNGMAALARPGAALRYIKLASATQSP